MTVSSEIGNDEPILSIRIYDHALKTFKPFYTGHIPGSYREKTLSDLRWYLIINEKLQKEYANSDICAEDGSTVENSMTLKKYWNLSKETTGHHSINFKRSTIRSDLTEKMSTFLEQPLDLTLTERTNNVSRPELQHLVSSFAASSWQAKEGKPSEIYPADMTERQWAVVMRNNDILSGKVLEFGKGKEGSVEIIGVRRARYQAFALKQREVPEYRAATAPPTNPKSVASGGSMNQQLLFQIPRFQIYDRATVDVLETKKSLDDALVQNAFDQTTIQASLGGGFMGVSVGVKAGFNQANSNASSIAKAKDEDYMHISYNFPRVELFLDNEDLELTKECELEIRKLEQDRTEEALDKFCRKFGHVFVPEVQLGGRLFSAEKTERVAGSSVQEKTQALKAAASASISGFGFQAEVSASHETNQNENKTKTEKKMTHSISWQADGGNTLYCNNPPLWCPTVSSFYNWRVMKQVGMKDIFDVIDAIRGRSTTSGIVIHPGGIRDVVDGIKGAAIKFSFGEKNDTTIEYKKFVVVDFGIDNATFFDPYTEVTGHKSIQGSRYGVANHPWPNSAKTVCRDWEIYAPNEDLVFRSGEPKLFYGANYALRCIINGKRYTLQKNGKNELYVGLDEPPTLFMEFGGHQKNIFDPLESGDIVYMNLFHIQGDARRDYMEIPATTGLIKLADLRTGITSSEREYFSFLYE